MDFEEFYAERVAKADSERRLFHEYILSVLPDKIERHRLEWENRRLEDDRITANTEANRINEELSRLQTEVHQAKEELKELHAAKEVRQNQIQRLLALPQPIQEDITYLVPERFPLRTESEAKSKVENVSISEQFQKYARMKTGDVTRLEKALDVETVRATAYLQEFNHAALEAEEDRRRHQVGNVNMVQELLADADQVLFDVENCEHQRFIAVAELLKLRLHMMIAQREEVEELYRLEKDRKYFIAKEERTKEQLLEDTDVMMRRIRAEQEDSNRQFEQQLAQLEGEIRAHRSSAKKITDARSDIYQKEDNLRMVLAEAKDRYFKLRRRNALEMEGFKNEAGLLRTKIRQVEKLYEAQRRASAERRNSRR